ncbi:hypothetical protein Tco_1458619 [Tanacetum coccineum]
MTEQDSPPPTITAMKIPIIKKGEYDIWSMRMRQYICHTDHNLWDIIVDGDLQEEAAPAGEQSSPPAPKTAKRNQERVKSILLLAIPDEYLLKFHNVPDAKSLWAAIKSRFGGNDESKKMQRNVLKHQFENFTTAPNESLDKAYDRFQKLISQLEVHAAPVSKEDINNKFLKSLYPFMVVKFTNEVSPASGNFRVNTAGGTSSSSQVLSTLGADEVIIKLILDIEGTELFNYSKQCLESFKTLQKNYDNEREKHRRAKLEIQGYELALEYLESRIIRHEKNELAWGEKYEFQNYELKCREVKINNLKMELEKVVKERDELKGTQLDEISNKSETDSEISMSVFEVRSSDEEITPSNNRFSKVDGYHAVPPPIAGNFLTLRADISFAGLDEYAIRKKIIKSKITEPKDDTSESKTSETVGKTNEVEIYKPKINRDKIIIEDWNSDDEDDVSEVNIVSPVKTNETQTVKTQVDKIGQISQKEGIRFKKIKACFVCKSTDYLIKDCDFYAKKSPEPKLKTMVNTGQRVVKPAWDNAKRVNHQKFSNKLKYPQTRRTFVLKGVLTKTSLVNLVRPNGKRAIHIVSTARPVGTARPFSPKIAQTGSAIRPIYPRMDNVRPRALYSPIKRSYYTKPAFRPKNLKKDVKTSRVKNMTTAGTRAVVNTSNVLKKSRSLSNPEIYLQDHVGMDSGNIHESPLRSLEAPLLEGNTSGSAEDSLNLKELMDIVPKLVLRIDNLEKELQQTKSTYGKVVLTLVERVKLLEAALKRKSMKVILSESEDEETKDQGRKVQDIDDDPLVSLVKNSMEEKEADFVTPKKNVSTYKRRARSASKGKDIGIGLDFFNAAKARLKSAEVEVNIEVNPGSAGVNTGNTPVDTPSVIQTVNVIVPSLVKSQREGKPPMTLEDDEEDARQVHLDALLAKRIKEEQELSEQQQKRKVEVQEAAQFYTEEDWNTIRAKLEANAELTKSLQGKNVSSDDFAKRMVDMINQKKKYYA